MPEVEYSEPAELDIDEIWHYIAQDSTQNADRFVDRLYQMCREVLAPNPMVGHSRDDLALGLRSHVFSRRYLIFYQPIENGVEIIRVVHGSRDIEPLF
jgi:toxin ParE1/3/4